MPAPSPSLASSRRAARGASAGGYATVKTVAIPSSTCGRPVAGSTMEQITAYVAGSRSNPTHVVCPPDCNAASPTKTYWAQIPGMNWHVARPHRRQHRPRRPRTASVRPRQRPSPRRAASTVAANAPPGSRGNASGRAVACPTGTDPFTPLTNENA